MVQSWKRGDIQLRSLFWFPVWNFCWRRIVWAVAFAGKAAFARCSRAVQIASLCPSLLEDVRRGLANECHPTLDRISWWLNGQNNVMPQNGLGCWSLDDGFWLWCAHFWIFLNWKLKRWGALTSTTSFTSLANARNYAAVLLKVCRSSAPKLMDFLSWQVCVLGMTWF